MFDLLHCIESDCNIKSKLIGIGDCSLWFTVRSKRMPSSLQVNIIIFYFINIFSECKAKKLKTWYIKI